MIDGNQRLAIVLPDTQGIIVIQLDGGIMDYIGNIDCYSVAT